MKRRASVICAGVALASGLSVMSGTGAQASPMRAHALISSAVVTTVAGGSSGNAKATSRSSKPKKFKMSYALAKRCHRALWYATQYLADTNYEAVDRLEVPETFLPSSDQQIKDAVFDLTSRTYTFDKQNATYSYSQIDNRITKGMALWNRHRHGAAFGVWFATRNNELPVIYQVLRDLHSRAVLVAARVRAAADIAHTTYPSDLDPKLDNSFIALEGPFEKVAQLLKVDITTR